VQKIDGKIRPRIVRGTTTLGLCWGKYGILFRRNMTVRQYRAHHRIHRGKATCVELGPLLIEF
jgi:hypothetical protein